jgi:uncharacterized protein (TIRG00374 family)
MVSRAATGASRGPSALGSRGGLVRRYAWIALGSGLLAATLLRIDAAGLPQAARAFPWGLGLAILALNGLPGLLKVARWRYLLRERGVESGLGAAYLSVNASFFLGLVTPGTTGEFSRALMLPGQAQKALATVTFEKLTDLAVLSFLAFVTGVCLFLPGAAATVALAAAGLAALGSYLLFLRFDGVFTRPLKLALERFLAKRHVTNVQSAWWEVFALLKQRRIVARSLGFSLLLWMPPVVQMGLIYRGLGLDLPATLVAASYFLPYFLGVVSWVPLGIGAFDLGVLELLRAHDPAAAAAGAPLFYRLLVTLPLIGLGWASQLALSARRREPAA